MSSTKKRGLTQVLAKGKIVPVSYIKDTHRFTHIDKSGKSQ
jgi:hypothetical protein